MATVIPIEQLRRSPTAALFEGGDEVAVSVFVVEYERDQGVGVHVHPYAEVFVVEAGTAVFTVDGEELTVDGGHLVVVPPQTPHGFRGAGEGKLRVVSVHPSGKTVQTWI